MDEKPDLPKPLEAFIIIVISFLFVIFVTQMMAMIFIPDVEAIDQNSLALKMLITVGEFGLILVPLVYVRSRNLSYKKVFRWRNIPGSLYIWSFIIGLSISVIGDELDRLVSIIIPAPELLGEISEALRIGSPADFVLLIVGTVIAASFIEESIIRGFLQTSLERYQDVTKAVIYSSLAWTIIHGMLYWAIQIFLVGIILGLIAWRSNSIVPSMIGHATNNAAALFFYNVNQENIEKVYLWGEHVSPLFIILAGIGLFYGIRKFYDYYGGTSIPRAEI